MNRKGFISTAALYSFFLVFCMLLILIMTTYTNNRVNYKSVKIDAKKWAYDNSSLKNRYFSTPDNPIIIPSDGPSNPDNPSPSPEPENPDNPAFSTEGYKTILINNGGGNTTYDSAINYIKGKSTPTFSKVATTNEGMFAANDSQGTSYYFRGAVNNNWIKYGKDSSNKDIYWRIIRINGDNSIRMIYSGTTAPTSSTSVVMTGAGSAIDRSVYNSGTNYAEYVGYMYQRGYQRNNTNNSTIKTKIDNWFAGTSLKNDSNVVDNIFCNDRSTSSSWSSRPSSNLLYNGHIRNLVNFNASLWCENKLDKFTTSSTLGNGSLTYPVGLITIDEVAMAGGYFATDNKNYYLYTGTAYYTMTPNFFRSTGSAFVFIVNNTGKFPNSSIGSTAYIRPVINLNGNVKLSGTGTYDNVYEVVKWN
ncbi:MAG: hypothetical protein PUA55_05145 [Mycoplasma sp.]|nr:hypothetical protein [Mycoplasma sp.]